MHAQNSRPELSAFLFNFTFSNTKMFDDDFLLAGEIKFCSSFQGRKRNPNPNFLVRIFSGGVGSSTARGGGQKVRCVPRKQGNQTFLGGISRDFAARISRRCPKSLRKKSLRSIFGPYRWFPRSQSEFLSEFREPLPGRLEYLELSESSGMASSSLPECLC